MVKNGKKLLLNFVYNVYARSISSFSFLFGGHVDRVFSDPVPDTGFESGPI
jgi:hypothetical protein